MLSQISPTMGVPHGSQENCSESEQTVLEKFSRKLKGSVDIYDEPIAAHRRHSLQDNSLAKDRHERRKKDDRKLIINDRYCHTPKSPSHNHKNLEFWTVENSLDLNNF